MVSWPSGGSGVTEAAKEPASLALPLDQGRLDGPTVGSRHPGPWEAAATELPGSVLA